MKEVRKEENKEGSKVSTQTYNLYSAKIDTSIMAHYCPGARTGHNITCLVASYDFWSVNRTDLLDRLVRK